MSDGTGSGTGSGEVISSTYSSVAEGLADVRKSLTDTETLRDSVTAVIEWAEARADALESQAVEMERLLI